MGQDKDSTTGFVRSLRKTLYSSGKTSLEAILVSDGGFPCFTPRSQDSVPNTMSGLMYWRAIRSSDRLFTTLWQFTFRILRLVFLGRS